MADTILMPALSPTMESGTLAKWHVAVGDTVSAGTLLADIETDKAVMEFESIDDGRIGALLVEDGAEQVAVNQPIAILLSADEAMPADADLIPSPAPVASAPDSKDEADFLATPQPAPAPPAAPPAVSHATTPSRTRFAVAPSSPPDHHAGRIFASPAARRLAAERHLKLEDIRGRGPNGRIVMADIEAHSPAASTPKDRPAAPAIDSIAAYRDRERTEVPLSGMRKVIAQRLSEAKATIPHFYLRRQVRIDPLLALRTDMNATLASSNRRLSVNDFVIKASALALQDVPNANVIWAGDHMVRLTPSDIAVAVAVDDGLYTPVIRDAHTKSMLEISSEMKELAARARDRTLTPEEYSGGAFSISNLGMYGVESFEAIINPPQGSILAVGAAQRVPVEAGDGSASFASAMTLTLSADHRMIDGALGAEFLAAIARYLQDPLLILI